jgi:4-aminobutyrate aminotransferase / (S)-3-amino-2-methylpropionate transaminase / 5-aminovalerate transaminase
MVDTHTPTLATVPVERRVVTAIPGPRSVELQRRRLAAVSGGASSAVPVFLTRAHGAIVEDVDGNAFVDLGSGIGVTTIGHTDDGVVAAAQEQVADLVHGMFTITPYESYVRVAELLAEHTPGDFAKKALLVNSGAEAVENGVKIARKHTGRQGVAVLDHAFHGRTNLTMSMTYKNMPYRDGFGPFAGEIHKAPNSYPLHDGLSGEAAAARTIAFLEKTAGARNLACLVAEPIQGEGGFIVPADGFLPALQAWCAENGIVFIADEIQSGLARTGRWFASEHFGLVPDLVLSAKALAGGLPLAAVVGRAEIMDASHAGGLGGTFGGNPVACAAAIAVFDGIERMGLLAEADRIGRTLAAALEGVRERHDVVAEVRGIGAMMAIELSDPITGEPRPDIVSAVAAGAAQQGVLILTAGTDGSVLRFLPPLVITDEQLLDAVGVIESLLP